MKGRILRDDRRIKYYRFRSWKSIKWQDMMTKLEPGKMYIRVLAADIFDDHKLCKKSRILVKN